MKPSSKIPNGEKWKDEEGFWILFKGGWAHAHIFTPHLLFIAVKFILHPMLATLLPMTDLICLKWLRFTAECVYVSNEILCACDVCACVCVPTSLHCHLIRYVHWNERDCAHAHTPTFPPVLSIFCSLSSDHYYSHPAMCLCAARVYVCTQHHHRRPHHSLWNLDWKLMNERKTKEKKSKSWSKLPKHDAWTLWK